LSNLQKASVIIQNSICSDTGSLLFLAYVILGLQTNFREKTVVGAVSLDFPTSEYSLDSIMRSFPGVLTKLASELSEIVTSVDI
jgi:hypothetical protein